LELFTFEVKKTDYRSVQQWVVLFSSRCVTEKAGEMNSDKKASLLEEKSMGWVAYFLVNATFLQYKYKYIRDERFVSR
jgi:hypothetical protein